VLGGQRDIATTQLNDGQHFPRGCREALRAQCSGSRQGGVTGCRGVTQAAVG
jgi:hypothetical protein